MPCGLQAATLGVLVVLFPDVVGLSLHARSRVPRKYAYATMVFNTRLLSEEQRAKLRNPIDRPGKSAPYWEKPLPGKLPYIDKTLGKHLERIPPKPTTAHAGQSYDGAVKIAEQLQEKGAKYPLLVFTNIEERLAGGVNSSISNVIPVNMTTFLTERTCLASEGYEVALQKILVWQLAEYDKIIWLDVDVDVMKNPDSVFEIDTHGGVMAMRNDPWCDYTPDYAQPIVARDRTSPRYEYQGKDGKVRTVVGMVNASEHHELSYRNTTMHDQASSIMLLEPNKQDFDGLVAISKELQTCVTDQDLIAEYFWRKSNTDAHELVQFFPSEVALWGRCVKPQLQKISSEPVFIHKKHVVSFQIR